MNHPPGRLSRGGRRNALYGRSTHFPRLINGRIPLTSIGKSLEPLMRTTRNSNRLENPEVYCD
jgi:hypothetical protein